MAAVLDTSNQDTVRRALAQRYGYSFESAARPPPPPPAPPLTLPPRTGGGVTFTGPRLGSPDRGIPKPPAWVRAYSRLTFGITPIARIVFNAFGGNDTSRYENMLEQQLAWESIDDSAVDNRLASAGYTTLNKPLTQLWAEHVAGNPDYNTRMRPAWEVQRSTLVRAVYSQRQLRERLVTFWNDHFNVTASDFDAGPVYVHYNRDVVRAHAFGNFRAMLEAMARSTAMLYYLDNRSNTRAGPNENFGRELLELHTLGAENYLGFVNPFTVPPAPEDPSYPIGYTDIDVYETAAAFTGWSVNTGTGGDGTFLYRANNHDTGPKTVLGMFLNPEQPALKDGQDVLDRLASHPRVAKFICKKLIRHFVDDRPPQALVDSAAEIFRANWQNSNQIRLTLRHILRSEQAREGWNLKQRRPAEVLIAAMRTAGSNWTIRPDHSRSNDLMYRLGFTGHVPHDWPAPNGYPDTANAWSGANSFAMTWKLLGWMAEARDDDAAETRLLSIVETSRAEVPQWTARNLVNFWCARILGWLPPPDRFRVLVAFMAQNGNPDTYVITDTNDWKASDLKGHYNHDRLRNMVSMILMSPEFFRR